MDETLRELKRMVERGEVGQRGFPVEVRKRAVAWARRRQAAGEPLREVAAQVGVSHETLRRWMKHGVSTFRRVSVAQAAPATPPSSGVVLRLANGMVVEGLRIEDVAALLRSLA